MPEQLHLYSADDYLDIFPRTATRNQTDLLALLAKNFVEQPPASELNLLQGIYQQTSHARQQFKPFIRPAIVALMICISLIALAVTQNLQLKKQDRQLVQEMHDFYKRLYPQDRRIKDPVAQMRGHLKQGKQGGADYFLAWMANISPLLQQHNISLINLKYDDEPLVLRLQIEARDYNALENLSAQINQLPEVELSAHLGTLQKSSLKNTVTSILTLKVK